MTVINRVPVRDAATVMLVRDDDDGELEVCMLQRRLQSEFVAGAFVFPGGAVDANDGEAACHSHCCGRTDIDASTQLGVESNGLAFWVAAIRESFEECGLLPAYTVDGEALRFDDPAVAGRFVQHRHAVDSGEQTLASICETEGLMLAVDTMHYFGRWITPPGAPRRYDTRFFVAPAPTGQNPAHDDHEVIASRWVSPHAALAQHRAGGFVMLPPTVASLKQLSRFATAAEALAGAAAATEVPTVAPRVVADDGGVRIVLPGDAEYGDGYSGDSARPDWSDLLGQAKPAT